MTRGLFAAFAFQRVDAALATLALLAALMPGFAAIDATLPLSAGMFFWSSVVGLTLGALISEGSVRKPLHALRRIARLTAAVVIWSGGLVAALLSIGQALPLFDVIIADIVAGASWVWKSVWREPVAGEPPQMLALALWHAALIRFYDQLITAPAAGERGAALMLSCIGVALAWSGAWLTGIAIRARKATFTYGLPLLAALGVVAIPGSGGGGPLVIGFGVWLLLAVASDFRRRELIWDAAGIDYSTELFRDAVAWGGLLTAGALIIAWLLPIWPGNPLARVFIRDDEIPSGLAALERSIQRPLPSGGTADIGAPVFAELPLGLSLEQGPPDQLALRVRLSEPLPPGREPRYWRARVFNRYTGDGWGSSARVADEPPVVFPEAALPGTILQDVEDLRPERAALVALPNPLFADIPVRAERLRDGSLMALVPIGNSSRYRVLSRLPEQTPPADSRQPGVELVDPGPYLALPGSLPVRVRDLAAVIAGDVQGDEARAVALERYLRNLPYVYQVEPLAEGVDGVDQFLFSMRSGYCTYYASAMAVMARALGIPSRVAVGYASGEYDERTGTYLVREADAHAWPELLIAGRWMAFEPTPIRPLPARGIPDPAPAPATLPVETAPPDRVIGLLIWLAVLIGAAALTVAGLRFARRIPPDSPLARAQRDLEQCGARAGVVWPPGATIREYAALVALCAPEIADDLIRLAALLTEARYSNHPLSPTLPQIERLTKRLRAWRPSAQRMFPRK